MSFNTKLASFPPRLDTVVCSINGLVYPITWLSDFDMEGALYILNNSTPVKYLPIKFMRKKKWKSIMLGTLKKRSYKIRIRLPGIWETYDADKLFTNGRTFLIRDGGIYYTCPMCGKTRYISLVCDETLLMLRRAEELSNGEYPMKTTLTCSYCMDNSRLCSHRPSIMYNDEGNVEVTSA